MKKLLALILAMCMVFALAACGAKTEAPAPAPAETPAEAPVEEAPAEEPLTWPSEGDINVLIPANTGGDTDTTFRTFSTSIGETLGTNVMLTNMSGGAGAVAINELLDYEPDGYTGIWHHYDSIILSMKGALDGTYEDVLDIAAVVPLSGGNYILTVNKASGWETLEDFVAYCNEHPGEVVWAIEAGGWSQVFAAYMVKVLGVDVTLVDFGSSSDRNAALLGGNAQVLLGPAKNLTSYPDDFVALGSCSLERQPAVPDVPTFKEMGYGDVESTKFYYFGFEKGTDPRIVEKMGDAIAAALETDEGKEVMANYNYLKYECLTGEAAYEYLKGFVAKYEPFVMEMLAAG